MVALNEKRGRNLHVVITLALMTVLFWASTGLARYYEEYHSGPVRPEYQTSQVREVQTENRTHDVGSMWLTITNYGYLGNDGEGRQGALEDPCTGEWAPQLEFPGGSGISYLFQAGLWIGAMIQEEGFEYPRVSVGLEGWNNYNEMYPGYSPNSGIEERSVRNNAINCLGDYVSHPDAVSEQDFIAVYSDTSDSDPLGSAITDPIDGPHVPLGIEVTQKSYAWSYNYARDFIIVDYEIENIADNFLKNLYIGLYVDADVGRVGNSERHTDDICGFTPTFSYIPEGQTDSITLTINSAWIADNDGRPQNVSSGNDFSAPGVTGTRVVRAPNPRLRTSFNWWISNAQEDIDFGPSWLDDGAPGEWTRTLGTPNGDTRKYFVLSNREFDYDQIRVDEQDWIAAHPQEFRDPFADPNDPPMEEHVWRTPDAQDPEGLAAGYDTRYLLSWGPLGIYDFTDDAGNRVYRLNPGEKFSLTVAFVSGENFHDRNHPQPSNRNINPDLFNYYDFQYNADWAAKVYDNPMIDTNGDTWFGEDVGEDGLYAANRGDTIRFINYDGTLLEEVYQGPDPGERDGSLLYEEDTAPRPIQFDYTYNNGLLDQGDGVPDFQGPPPPPAPNLEYRSTQRRLYLRWSPEDSEDPNYSDPFSGQQDFEGYRVYVSNTGMENEYSYIAEFDIEDYAYYSQRDSLMSVPIKTDRPDTLEQVVTPEQALVIPYIAREFREVGYLQPVGPNVGFEDILVYEGSDSTYEFDLGNVNPMIPRYYTVTAYDYGDPLSGTESLETAKTSNAIYAAPSGDASRRPGVVPNPYRADQDYTQRHMQLVYDVDTTYVSWENRNDGTADFFPQTDRRMIFYNLPQQCLIRIFTVSGDLVQIIDHNIHGNRISTWVSDHAESWDLNSRNNQQVVSGLYLFSVEDMTPENRGHIDVGKFVIIR